MCRLNGCCRFAIFGAGERKKQGGYRFVIKEMAAAASQPLCSKESSAENEKHFFMNKKARM